MLLNMDFAKRKPKVSRVGYIFADRVSFHDVMNEPRNQLSHMFHSAFNGVTKIQVVFLHNFREVICKTDLLIDYVSDLRIFCKELLQ